MTAPSVFLLASIAMFGVASCASQPKLALPDGTYREESGKVAALIVSDGEVAFHLPPDDRWRLSSKTGRTYPYRLRDDGSLGFYGSSNDSYFLRLVLDYRWRWDGSKIEGTREDGATMTFARATGAGPWPPASQAQHIWLAAARHVLANESASAQRPGALSILARTSYPLSRRAMSRLKDEAQNGLCGLSGEDAKEVLSALRWVNARETNVRDVFEHRPEFALVDSPSVQGDYLGLSGVVFSRDTDFAHLNVDISGQSGSIVRMEKQDGAWAWSAECATWINY